MSLTFTDIFCGAGGSSIGLASAGMELKLAANHWDRAIETHAANFRDAEHVCADVNNYDMRRLPRTDVLWASPICTEASPAGGQTGKRSTAATELGSVAQEGFERTRATFWDVIRATEVHRYSAVLIENVPDVATRWELFDHWVRGMELLGYAVQFVSASSAHIGDASNPHAPQWRDRLYLVFTRNGVRLPDVEPRPVAWCTSCTVDVAAVQRWKRTGRRIGKYRRQYAYVCPNGECRQPVEPYILPAAAAINWTDLGERIGDRVKPLAPNTVRRIQAGLEMFAGRQVMVTLTHGANGTGRALPIHGAAMPTRTAKIGEGIASHPMLVPAGGTWNDAAASVLDPMRTRTAREAEALVVPRPFIATLRNHAIGHSIDQPFRTMAAGGHHHALVVPFRRGNRPQATEAHDSGLAVEDCHFRMLRPREQLRAQRFPDSYVVLGNIAEQTMQAGNAVSANVAQWLGERVTSALGGGAQ
jgi:DNA (cytosine-5)-methyltransferase 1